MEKTHTEEPTLFYNMLIIYATITLINMYDIYVTIKVAISINSCADPICLSTFRVWKNPRRFHFDNIGKNFDACDLHSTYLCTYRVFHNLCSVVLGMDISIRDLFSHTLTSTMTAKVRPVRMFSHRQLCYSIVLEHFISKSLLPEN